MYTRIYIYIYIHICIYIYICNVDVYIYIYIYIHAHMYKRPGGPFGGPARAKGCFRFAQERGNSRGGSARSDPRVRGLEAASFVDTKWYMQASTQSTFRLPCAAHMHRQRQEYDGNEYLQRNSDSPNQYGQKSIRPRGNPPNFSTRGFSPREYVTMRIIIIIIVYYHHHHYVDYHHYWLFPYYDHRYHYHNLYHYHY